MLALKRKAPETATIQISSKEAKKPDSRIYFPDTSEHIAETVSQIEDYFPYFQGHIAETVSKIEDYFPYFQENDSLEASNINYNIIKDYLRENPDFKFDIMHFKGVLAEMRKLHEDGLYPLNFNTKNLIVVKKDNDLEIKVASLEGFITEDNDLHSSEYTTKKLSSIINHDKYHINLIEEATGVNIVKENILFTKNEPLIESILAHCFIDEELYNNLPDQFNAEQLLWVITGPAYNDQNYEENTQLIAEFHFRNIYSSTGIKLQDHIFTKDNQLIQLIFQHYPFLDKKSFAKLPDDFIIDELLSAMYGLDALKSIFSIYNLGEISTLIPSIKDNNTAEENKKIIEDFHLNSIFILTGINLQIYKLNKDNLLINTIYNNYSYLNKKLYDQLPYNFNLYQFMTVMNKPKYHEIIRIDDYKQANGELTLVKSLFEINRLYIPQNEEMGIRIDIHISNWIKENVYLKHQQQFKDLITDPVKYSQDYGPKRARVEEMIIFNMTADEVLQRKINRIQHDPNNGLIDRSKTEGYIVYNSANLIQYDKNNNIVSNLTKQDQHNLRIDGIPIERGDPTDWNGRATDEDGNLILCRQLAFKYLKTYKLFRNIESIQENHELKTNVYDNNKAYKDIFKSIESIQQDPDLKTNIYDKDRIHLRADSYYPFNPENIGEQIYKINSLSQKNNIYMNFSTAMHVMATPLTSQSYGMFKLLFFDPRHSITHKIVIFKDVASIKNLKLTDLLEKEDINIYFPSIKSGIFAVYNDPMNLRSSDKPTVEFKYLDLNTLTNPELMELMYYALYFNEPLTIKKAFAKLKELQILGQLTNANIENLLNPQNSQVLPLLYFILQVGHAEAITAFFSGLKELNLEKTYIETLLDIKNNKGCHAFMVAFQQEHIAAITAFFSGLKELLNLETAYIYTLLHERGIPLLCFLLLEGHTKAIKVYIDLYLSMNLNIESSQLIINLNENMKLKGANWKIHLGYCFIHKHINNMNIFNKQLKEQMLKDDILENSQNIPIETLKNIGFDSVDNYISAMQISMLELHTHDANEILLTKNLQVHFE